METKKFTISLTAEVDVDELDNFKNAIDKYLFETIGADFPEIIDMYDLKVEEQE